PDPFISADTIYFGGGTPSLLSPEEIAAIIEAARSTFALAPESEITLEANPESVDLARLKGYREAGINRLSYGVQSFHDDELKRLGRLHSAQRAEEAVETARAAGFDNISVDLMMWLPGQDLATWLSSLERAVACEPEHLSLYILEVYPHLPLKQDIAAHGWPQVDDEGVADMYETGMAMLDAAGYEQYEISNVARPGRRSSHNMKYWTDGEWLGFGPGAHSTRQGARWRNVSATDDYIGRITAGTSPVSERRVLSSDECLGDAVFTGLRLSQGVDLSALSARYAVDIWARFAERLAPFEEAGLLVREGARIRLTRQGMLLANEVMAVFV
ncbi:MAG: radical SAM family heme chaperone HemW, partial [Vicinamibacterales bacterium]|nr:radical SAM family heme chaperone HemW [Vicinamibacterales bacterium]